MAFHRLQQTSDDDVQKIHLNNGQTTVVVDDKDIVFINAEHVYINVHIDNKEKVVIRQSLSDMVALLDSEKFIQPHRSYLVNIHHIIAYDSHQLQVKNEVIPISRSRKEDVLKRLK